MKCLLFIAIAAFALNVGAAPEMPDGGWWYGVCEDHEWRGFARDNEPDASKDLEAHVELFPDEPHENTRIERSDR